MSDYTGKRITPEEVVKAYEKTGMKPVRGTYLKGNQCCGLTACVGAKGALPKWDFMETIIERLSLDREYAQGFICGFDDDEIGTGGNPAFVSGCTDGRSTATRVFTETPRS